MTATTAPTERAVVHEVVHSLGLERVTRRPAFGDYLAQLWGRRHFIVADARGRVASGTRGTHLGTLWLVLKPILDGAVYFLIFGVLLGVNKGIENFLGYLIIGIFLFTHTSRCLSKGAGSLITGRALIRAFSFPRASLPLASVVTETISLVPVIGVMLALIVAIPPYEAVTWRWLLLPVILALQTVFNLGIALLAARATARVPDLLNVISFATRLWLYGSGVMFSFDRFVDHPILLAVLEFNPLFVVLDMARDVLLYATTPSPYSWAVLTGWAAATVSLGIVFFWRGEASYGGA